MKVTYDAINGVAVKDGEVELRVSDWIYYKEIDIVVSTFLVIEALRVAVKEKKLSPKELELFFKSENGELVKIEIDENGKIINQPQALIESRLKFWRKLVIPVHDYGNCGIKDL